MNGSPCNATDPEVANTIHATALAWGKAPVHARSTPGFIVNRCARPFYAEALRVLGTAEIDLVLLDIKSSDPDTYRRVTGRDLAPTLRFAARRAAIASAEAGSSATSCLSASDMATTAHLAHSTFSTNGAVIASGFTPSSLQNTHTRHK